MLSTGRLLLLLLCAAALPRAQDVSPPADPLPPDPKALVAAAEELCGAAAVEDAVLLLWRALAELDPGPAENEATIATARRLLAAHDPHHESWCEASARVARLQAGLAAMYRRKKWYDTAAQKLATAERFDRDAARAERIAFDKLRYGGGADPAGEPAAGDAGTPTALFDRANTSRVDGTWRPVDGGHLECGAHDGEAVVATWLTKTTHGDGEIVLELRPTDAAGDRNAGLVFGATDAKNYYCARFGSLATNKFDFIEILRVKDNVEARLAGISERNAGRIGAEHRFVLHVRGSHVRFQVDNRRPVEVDTGSPVRGHLGLCVGVTGFATCPIRFSRFEVGPLPGREPTADELLAEQQEQLRDRIGAAVAAAEQDVANKNLEAAAARLRGARRELASLSDAAERAALGGSIAALLPKADRQHKKRKKAERETAAALVTLADEYAAAAMPRAALALVREAQQFTPLELVERHARARLLVEAWRAARSEAPAAPREPTIEGSAELRRWFTEGRPLYSHSTIRWVVEGRSARVDDLEAGQIAALMPRDGLPPLSRASITVRLPSAGAAAGFCFDVAGSHDFAVVLLERAGPGVVLTAQRWRDRKWSPLGKATIERPPAALDGWLTLTIEATGDGLTARAAGSTVEIGGAALGETARRYGLAVTNSGDAATIELAAFEFSR